MKHKIVHELNGTFGLVKNKHQNIAEKSNKSQNPLEIALGAYLRSVLRFFSVKKNNIDTEWGWWNVLQFGIKIDGLVCLFWFFNRSRK